MNGLIISIACIISSSQSEQLGLTNSLCFENCRLRNLKLMYFTEVLPKIGDIQDKKRSSLYTSLVAHQGGAYPGFRSMKRLGVFLLPPGWDASPSQGYPQQ